MLKDALCSLVNKHFSVLRNLVVLHDPIILSLFESTFAKHNCKTKEKNYTITFEMLEKRNQLLFLSI